MQVAPKDIGWIEVICGPMFSGKTEELIRRLRRAVYARQQVEIYKPKIDTRYATIEIVSHSKQRLQAKPVANATEILTQCAPDVEVVGIDEAQFFDRELVGVANQLANRGVRVILAGLDQDYRGVPFEPMPALLAVAEFVTKSLAICMVCGNPAGRSQRLIRADDKVVLGAAEFYEARCRKCHQLDRPLPEQERLFR
jgi:thymidine kinase